jgi:3-methyladenine DNA glycosylase/8-oxoguanine DNA glycosylase
MTMTAVASAPSRPQANAPFGVARTFRPAPTLRSLLAAELRIVAAGSFRPRGGRYDVRPLRIRPVRALRGGPGGMVAAFAVKDGGVEIRILTRARAISADDLAWAMERARGMCAVDDDPTEFLAMAHLHPLVADLAMRFDCRIDRTPTVFEAFTRAAPTARAVLDVPPWQLHAMGIGSRRSRTLREGARRGAALERLRGIDPALAATKLESLPGVGPWTANLVARTALGWSDAVPVRDCHAHYVISEALTGVQGDDDAMLEALAPFRPHRARVVRLVTQAQIAGALPGEERGRHRLPRIDPHRREPWKY